MSSMTLVDALILCVVLFCWGVGLIIACTHLATLWDERE